MLCPSLVITLTVISIVTIAGAGAEVLEARYLSGILPQARAALPGQ